MGDAAEQLDLVLVGHDDVAPLRAAGVEYGCTGAGLSTVIAPAARPARERSLDGRQRHLQLRRAPLVPRAPRRPSTVPLAPATTMIEFSPADDTTISARPVAGRRSATCDGVDAVVGHHRAAARRPAASSTDRADERHRRAGAGRGDRLVQALAARVLGVAVPGTVSPGPGSRSTVATRSRLALPTTHTSNTRESSRLGAEHRRALRQERGDGLLVLGRRPALA